MANNCRICIYAPTECENIPSRCKYIKDTVSFNVFFKAKAIGGHSPRFSDGEYVYGLLNMNKHLNSDFDKYYIREFRYGSNFVSTKKVEVYQETIETIEESEVI